MAQPSQSRGAKAAGGCFFVVFGLPFLGFGLLFLSQGILAFFGRNFVDIQGSPIWIALFGLVFALAGGGFVWAGLAAGKWKGRRRPRKVASDDDWRTSKLFPDCAERSLGGRFALRPEATRMSQFVAMLAVSLFWNGIVGFMAYHAISDMSGPIRVLPVIFFGFFGLLGLLILGGAIHMFLKLLLVGETVVEVSRAPLAPGDKARMALRQKGDFRIDSLTVELLCREVVRYTVGTDTHTHTEEVHAETLAKLADVRAGSGPLVECEIAIPRDAMHSLRLPHNEVQWGVRVTMLIPGRPDVEEIHRLRVVPEWKDADR